MEESDNEAVGACSGITAAISQVSGKGSSRVITLAAALFIERFEAVVFDFTDDFLNLLISH